MRLEKIVVGVFVVSRKELQVIYMIYSSFPTLGVVVAGALRFSSCASKKHGAVVMRCVTHTYNLFSSLSCA